MHQWIGLEMEKELESEQEENRKDRKIVEIILAKREFRDLRIDLKRLIFVLLGSGQKVIQR